MKLNCDLGEGFGAWKMADDTDIMPYIDMANVACGFHAGDPLVICRTISSALSHGVDIGAHPGYPDLQGFGRRSMKLSAEELKAMLLYQISALDGLTESLGGNMSYVKPHGALYNDMMRELHIFDSVIDAVSSFHKPLKLVVLAGAVKPAWAEKAADAGVPLLLEAFADRRYLPSGKLQPRGEEGAVLSHQDMLEQVNNLYHNHEVVTANGTTLKIQADTLCVHGDTPDALNAAKNIRSLIA